MSPAPVPPKSSSPTWLDLHPPNTEQASKGPKPKSRVEIIRDQLISIRADIEIQKHLIALADTEKGRSLLYNPNNKRYIRVAKAHHKRFDALEKEVDAVGDFALPLHLKNWENSVNFFREQLMSLTEKMEWNGWDDTDEIQPGIFKDEWNFADATGKGSGLGDEVDPKDASKPNLEKDAGKFSHLYAEEAEDMV